MRSKTSMAPGATPESECVSVKSGGCPRYIALFGLFGIGNIGNEATLQTTLVHLRKQRPDATALVICPGPATVAAMYNVDAIDWNPNARAQFRRAPEARIFRRLQRPFRLAGALWQLGRTILRCDLLVVPGTGVLDDYALSDHTMPRLFLLWCVAAKVARVPVIFSSVGAGPIQNSWTRQLMKFTACLATARSYRDEYSRQFLAGLGIHTRRDRVLPDLAFSHELPPGLLPSLTDTGIALTVGIGMMSYFGWSGNMTTGEPIYRAYIAQMSGFARQLLEEGYSIRFLVGKESDNRAIDDLIQTLPASCAPRQLSRSPIRNMRDLLVEINRCDVVVATRFHNVVAALMLGRPTLSIGYSEKNDAVMHGCGLGDFCQPIETLQIPRLLEQFNRAVAHRGELRQIVAQKAAQHRVTLDHYFREVFSPEPRSQC